MIEHTPKEEVLSIIREIETNPVATQRVVSYKIGISLGKTNYLLKELIKKGVIEARNFTDGPNKLKKIRYHLTKSGFEYKIGVMQHFLREKEAEYNTIKKEWEELVGREKSGI
jgi:EPS-associated MarR family transcriptional regulator